MAQKRRLFELEGLKFEIGRLKIDVTGDDGERQLKMALTEEFNRVIEPVTQVLRPQLDAAPTEPATTAAPVTDKRPARRTARPRAANSPAATDAAPLDWKPDVQKHGNPTP